MEYRSQRENLFGNQKAQRQVSGFRVLRQLSLKADLHGTIFAYDYRVRIAYVMTYDHPHIHAQFSPRTSTMCRTNVVGLIGH